MEGFSISYLSEMVQVRSKCPKVQSVPHFTPVTTRKVLYTGAVPGIQKRRENKKRMVSKPKVPRWALSRGHFLRFVSSEILQISHLSIVRQENACSLFVLVSVRMCNDCN